MILTKKKLIATIIIPRIAKVMMLRPLSMFSSTPPAVSILNDPQKSIAKNTILIMNNTKGTNISTKLPTSVKYLAGGNIVGNV